MSETRVSADRLRVRLALIIWLVAATPLQAQSGVPNRGDVLTLDRVLELALQSSRDLQNAALEVQSATDNLVAAGTRRPRSVGHLRRHRSDPRLRYRHELHRRLQ